MNPSRIPQFARWLFWAQGIYYLVTGIWPLVHMPSFLAVTGPKTDLWLVQTVGIVIAAIGLSLCVAAAQRRSVRYEGLPLPSCVLAAGSALGLMMVDIVFTSEKIISPIYLLDGVVEAVLLLGWVLLVASSLLADSRQTRDSHLALWGH